MERPRASAHSGALALRFSGLSHVYGKACGLAPSMHRDRGQRGLWPVVPGWFQRLLLLSSHVLTNTPEVCTSPACHVCKGRPVFLWVSHRDAESARVVLDDASGSRHPLSGTLFIGQ